MSAQFRALERATARANLANNGETLPAGKLSPAVGNPVGSRGDNESLDERTRNILVGTILGDGCLERNGRNVRIRIDHSVNQRDLVEWKWKELSALSPSIPRLVERIDSRTGNLHRNLRFTTQTTSKLNELFSYFYGSLGLKRVPVDISNVLNHPISVAVWYMDDGGRRKDCRSGYLNTNAYSVDEVDTLRNCLELNFDIETRIHFAAQKPRIYIPQSQFDRFCELIRSLIIPSMQYKLL